MVTREMVTEVTATGLHTKSGKFVDADIQVWSAGIKAPAFLTTVGLEVNRINQIIVDATLQAQNEDGIFAFGDCAQCPMPEGEKSVPPRAQAAS
jgi:NADH dehydrogenase